MPLALKKRKISEATTHNASTPASRGTIAAFGRISKSGLSAPSTKANLLATHIGDEPNTENTLSKRRKISETLETPPKTESYNISSIAQTRNFNPFEKAAPETRPVAQSPSLPALPIKPRKKAPPRPKAVHTPTKGARAFLEAFALSSSPPSLRSSSPLPQHSDTPPTSPISEKSPCPAKKGPNGLPDEVQDLVNLNSAFLTALSLHYAHNGSFTPADLRVLRPSVERAWGKRRICTEDIQRILGILSHYAPGNRHDESCPFSLSNYGNGKICVETTQSISQPSFGRHPVEVGRLTTSFLDKINELWQNGPSADTASFITTLPLAPITICLSVSKVSPLLAKGQRRLEDLKAGAIRAQITNNLPKPNTSLHAARPKPTTSRSVSLLSRIRSKELHQSTLPPPLSAESIARKTALQRLEEVIPVLEILTTSGSRSVHDGAMASEAGERTFSFTVPTVVQHLQMSLRNPISKDEAVRCMRLLAEEIVPEWVSVRKVGKVMGVTLRGTKGVGREKIVGRIGDAMGKV